MEGVLLAVAERSSRDLWVKANEVGLFRCGRRQATALFSVTVSAAGCFLQLWSASTFLSPLCLSRVLLFLYSLVCFS